MMLQHARETETERAAHIEEMKAKGYAVVRTFEYKKYVGSQCKLMYGVLFQSHD